eukprot:6562058-Alexandrium_andersonii.AAC.1
MEYTMTLLCSRSASGTPPSAACRPPACQSGPWSLRGTPPYTSASGPEERPRWLRFQLGRT